ncbi:TadE/TadG family type IV pilus assembly protein [Sphingomonas glacialis]|uniref:Pilus assembly protein n=1 Tax=Sphingomonas glacialis TaxID=658225 RepID=A0A502FAK6_9SPHN|nr:TadE/TadG family type IV pilus assembly protein [Sphingomonas glacialis]TPG46392.1 pilus assembly protein [Sphingomonas glacialis]
MKVLRNKIRARSPLPRLLCNLGKNRDGAAALEFAIVGPALIGLILAILYTALIFLAQQMLETAALASARLFLTGSAQTIKMANGQLGMSANDLKNAICNGTTGTDSSGHAITIAPLLPPMLSCSRLTVNVSTASSYNVTSTAAPTFTYNSAGVITSTNTGYNTQSGGDGQSQILVLQLIYLWPTGTGPLGLNLTNQPNGNRMLVATSVSTTEAYSCNSGQTSC